MATMSEATVRVHETSKDRWRETVQTLLDRHGDLEDLRHMAHFYRGNELLFSCTVEFEQPEMKTAMATLGTVFGCVPGVTSLTLHLHSTIRRHSDPTLVDEDAVATLTLEMDHIGDAVLFDRRSTLTHYWTNDGHLYADEVAPESEELETWVYDILELTGGAVATGNTEVTEEHSVETFLPLLQAVQFANEQFWWEFVPVEAFELSIIQRLLNDYNPQDLITTRDNHAGMRLMTPRLVAVDRLEEL